MRMKTVGWLLGCAALAAACQPPPATPPSGSLSEAELKQLDQRVQEYFKKSASLPDSVTQKLVDVVPAAAPGLMTASLQASSGTNTQKVPLVLTRDGRYLMQGHITDLNADPFQSIVDQIELKDQPMRGNPNAAVTIVEYSDFQCPFCRQAYKMIEEQVMKDYGDKVRLVYKNFPLTNIHPWAESAALASACARQQSPAGFWKMYDYFFQNQETIDADNLKAKAEDAVRGAGLDVDKFDACFDNQSAAESLKADDDEATALGINSTPTFFVNGRKLEGAVPYESFKAVIDQALGQAKNPAVTPAASGS